MGGSRFLVIAKPSPMERDALEGALLASGLKARLQGAMFDSVNWHQTLSDRFSDPGDIPRLKRACANVRTRTCTLTWNRIRCEDVHWSFKAFGRPSCFTDLLSEVTRALTKERLSCLSGHTPHITISYWAPSARMTHRIRPIQWTIDEILLVEGHRVGRHEEHYRYDVIDHWPLQPVRQRDLF